MQFQKFFKNKKSAFTLIEVMVAMLVLAIGLLGLAGITIVVLKSNTLSQQISEATTIAADLMDTLKRQNISSLPNCDSSASNSIQLSAAQNSTSCAVLADSGVASVPLQSGVNIYLPAATNGSNANCAVANVLDTSGTAMTFNVVASNLMVLNSFNSSDTVCDRGTNFNFPARSYMRYYRTFAPSSGSSDRTIAVVVLWKDKYNRWRNVHLSTTRTN
ncbi:MAG: prepilin-type N-terminal cleavage/methylation domain-containing protein [Deltaproteobacteria bacterium]|nr:prepilin-type N-terminal cleavage/methylation domain-containing protein [Deltaproteobacteria bacterium]